MKSTLKLYASTAEKPFKLESSKLFAVENIADYLAQFTPTLIENFQFNTINGMQGSIKIILDETNISPLKNYRYKYCSIQNTDEAGPRYYFITNIVWRSNSSCMLELLLDILNTFKVGTDYSFNAKTNILREHRNRFQINSNQKREFVPVDDLILSGAGAIWHTNWWYFWGKIIIPDENVEIVFPEGIVADAVLMINDGALTISQKLKFNKIVINAGPGLVAFYYGLLPVYITAQNVIVTGNRKLVIKSPYFDEWREIASRATGILGITNDIQRIIDKNSEEINPVLYLKEKETIEDKNSQFMGWNLVYRNQNEPSADDTEPRLKNPVECYLVPDEDVIAKYTGTFTTGNIYPNDLESGVLYFINPYRWGIPYDSLKDDNNDSLLLGDNNSQVFFRKSDDGTKIVITRQQYTNAGFYVTSTSWETTTIVSTAKNFRYGTGEGLIDTDNWEQRAYFLIPYTAYSGNIWEVAAYSTETINGIGVWDKTDPKMIKIIKLPYIPDDIVISNGYYIPDNKYTIEALGATHALKLTDLNFKFLNHIDPYITSPIYRVFDASNIFESEDYESKIYSSEFTTYKYVYDSFALPIVMENVDYDTFRTYDIYGSDLNVNFYVTTSINSRFAFEIADYVCTRGDSDYYNWLVVARNNESVLYNVAYLNYIRTGYNYDVKNKNVSTAMSWASFGAGMIGTIGAIAGAIYTGGIAIPMAVGLATTTAMTLANSINTTSKNERDLQQKLDQLKNQSANVSGSDDFDLMLRYNGNRLLLMKYEASEEMINLVKRLFYYTGYRVNVYGIPSTKTRNNFNYLQCNPVFDIFAKNINKEIEEQIILAYKTGVTFIHKYNNTWDMEQTSENIEIMLQTYKNNSII